nr:GH25 family lysozyme [Kibdelosporangium sp. MJ126-NF4]CEL21634.1 Lyzozyme M1 (1,4-beta-N-acetylmuramidase) [Kibdelosporangium sp. MJ126-NF4]CTQ92415.1 Lyzozyme M1 (1,4-beta-N-acetylmuramidase) (EC 3.2.1.17) [Kibdelosporangium sp. MJ126-NF4]
MARGIDIYRYQTVTDWNAVRNSGVEFVWVKLSDGFGPAIVRGDRHVGGAKSVGIPVGGYHFAQKGDPARQAHVFLGEINRLGAWGIVPALDIENTGVQWGGQEAHDFSVGFLAELRRFSARVALYSNTSQLRSMRAAEIAAKVPGTVIWEANYGNNNGQQHGLPSNAWDPYRGAHQFTSVGRVPGIIENTDINASFVDLRMDEDMEWTDVETHGRTGLTMPIGDWIGEIKNDTSVLRDELQKLADAISGQLSPADVALASAVAAVRNSEGNPTDEQVAALADRIASTVGPDLAAKLGQRLTGG